MVLRVTMTACILHTQHGTNHDDHRFLHSVCVSSVIVAITQCLLSQRVCGDHSDGCTILAQGLKLRNCYLG